jgi:transketolase
MFERRLVKRARDGSFEVKLPEEERRVLAEVLPQLKLALEGDPAADPGFKRLFPVAYAQDPELEQEYRAMVGDELLAKRIAQVDTVLATVHATRLSEEEVFAWMGAVNDLRLVLGTRLDVSEETSLDVDRSHPDAPAYGLYAYLGWLLELLVDGVS